MKIKFVVVDLEIPPRVKKWGLRIGIPLGVVLGWGAIAWAAGLTVWTNGQSLQAADLNANFDYLQSEITALQARAFTPSAFNAYMTGSQSVPNGANTTAIFDTDDFDLNSEYNHATGVFTAANAGTYWFHCSLDFAPNPGGTFGDWAAGFMKNGTTPADLPVAELAYAGNRATPSVGSVVRLNAGDTIECYAFQNSGSAQTIATGRNFFSGARLF